MTYLIFLWSSGLMMSYDMCVTGHIIPWWNCLWWCQCFSLLSLSYQTYVYMADVVKRSMHSTELNGQVIMNTRCKISPLLIEILCLSIHEELVLYPQASFNATCHEGKINGNNWPSILKLIDMFYFPVIRW